MASILHHGLLPLHHQAMSTTINTPPAPKFVSGAAIKKNYQVSTQSLHRWAEEGKMRVIKTPGGARRYSSTDVANIFRQSTSTTNNDATISHRLKICYARVSSDHQKEDLIRQIQTLKTSYPDHTIISDIGSGLNFKRPGFKSLLDSVHEGNVEEIVVLYKDRLCRFGIELVEFICQKASCKILVHSNCEQLETNHEQELAQDLLSIITVFVARNNGQRAGQNRRLRRSQKQFEEGKEKCSKRDLSSETDEEKSS